MRRRYASWQIAKLAWRRSATSFQGVFESSSALAQKRLANDCVVSTLASPSPLLLRRREEARNRGLEVRRWRFGRGGGKSGGGGRCLFSLSARPALERFDQQIGESLMGRCDGELPD